MPAIHASAPQFLVDNLEEAMAYYTDRLGFVGDFAYEGFYGSVSRDGATIHLKCAPKANGERAFRREEGHLDAFIRVDGVDDLYREVAGRGARIIAPPGDRPWFQRDFSVEDLDGYILCFSEPMPG